MNEPAEPLVQVPSALPLDTVVTSDGEPVVLIARTARGWTVLGRDGAEGAGDLVEALSLADLVVDELDPGTRPAPPARPSGDPDDESAEALLRELAQLRRTVGQLEHALTTRVSTERAIGVLAERQGQSPRAAFEGLRRQARASGRLVHDLARDVLDALPVTEIPPPAAPVVARPVPAVRGAEVGATRSVPAVRSAEVRSAAVRSAEVTAPRWAPGSVAVPPAPEPAQPSDETAARSGPRRTARALRTGTAPHRGDAPS